MVNGDGRAERPPIIGDAHLLIPSELSTDRLFVNEIIEPLNKNGFTIAEKVSQKSFQRVSVR
jgi:hypothetical protein